MPDHKADPRNMPFQFSELVLHHRNIEYTATVITPKTMMTFGRDRIGQLSKPTGISRVERWMIEEVGRRGERARVLLFRAVNTQAQRVWQFDPDMSEQELEDAGVILTKALLPFHRRLMASGVVLMVHTEWGVRECYAMRHGLRVLARELDSKSNLTPVEEVDRWLLSHMLLHVALNIEHVTTTLLPTHLTMIERRWPRVRELVALLPPEAVD